MTAVIDTDVHTTALPMGPEISSRVPARWHAHLRAFGLRHAVGGGERPRQRPFAARVDAWPDGGLPGTDPAFVREQLLDRYELTGAVLNDILAFRASGADNYPRDLSIALNRAYNDWHRECWLAHDPRWHCSINVPYEDPEAAVAEIRRCREEFGADGQRMVQVLLPSAAQLPLGNRRYWPIYEACEHYGIPVGLHVFGHRSAAGNPTYYLEEHVGFAGHGFVQVPSLIFEGVFERFPGLKVALLELTWAWVVPLAWRLDASFKVLGGELTPHLQRLPSEYLRDHFRFSTQPMEEPERPEWFGDLLGQLLEAGMGECLMYSSDYPHWDFDEPSFLPGSVAPDVRRRILGENAARLYGIARSSSPAPKPASVT